MKFNSQFMKTVQHDLEQGLIPFLLGEPGIGKSSWVTALGDLLHTKTFVLACNQLADKADLTGSRLVPDNKGGYETFFYPHSIINQACIYAEENPRETPILFLDELNRTTPDVTSELLSIPTLRSIGNKGLPKNLRVICAGNDKGNITSLDTASITRFVLYHVDPDVETFLGLDPQLNPFVRETLTKHPETLLCKSITVQTTNSKDDDDDSNADNAVDINEILDDGEVMNQMATPRTISGVSRWLNTFTNEELMEMLNETHKVDGEEVSFLQEVLEGHTGKTSFTAFLLSEIANGLLTVNNQSNQTQVPKPQCYDALKTCKTTMDVEQMVQTLTDNEKSGCLVYALYEKADNTALITCLLSNMKDLTPSDTKTVVQLAVTDNLDSGNLAALLKVNHLISQKLQLFEVS